MGMTAGGKGSRNRQQLGREERKRRESSRSVAAGKGWVKAPEGPSRTKANTEVTLPLTALAPSPPTAIRPHLRQSVQAVEVPWPSLTCCCGCCCCPHSGAQVMVSLPASLTSLHPGPSSPLTELRLWARGFPSLGVILIVKMGSLRLREATVSVQRHICWALGWCKQGCPIPARLTAKWVWRLGRLGCQVWLGFQGCSGPKQKLQGSPPPWPVPRAPSFGAKAWSKHCSAEHWGTAFRRSGDMRRP